VVRTIDQWDELISSIKSRIWHAKARIEGKHQDAQSDEPKTASEIARAQIKDKKFFTDQ
jgi:hypothetical protein